MFLLSKIPLTFKQIIVDERKNSVDSLASENEISFFKYKRISSLFSRNPTVVSLTTVPTIALTPITTATSTSSEHIEIEEVPQDEPKIERYFLIRDNTKKDRRRYCFIPIWGFVLGILFLTMAFIILAAGLLLIYMQQRPGLYNEECDTRPCLNGLNLTCINKVCSCSSNQYYAKGCQNKKDYNEKCNGNTNYCKDQTNMICRDGVCKCNDSDYWDGQKCLKKKLFGDPCINNNECSDILMLYCDSVTNTCSCNSRRYWDSTTCFPKKIYNETCISIQACRTDLRLNCQNSVCLCDQIYFWNGNMCAGLGSYTNPCVNDTQCGGTLICNNGTGTCNCPLFLGHQFCDCPNALGKEYYWNGIDCVQRVSFNGVCSNTYMCRVLSEGTICKNSTCQCSALQYYNVITSTCVNQLLYNQTCSIPSSCRSDLGLTCQTSVCLCNSTQFWNGSMCINYLTYKGSCTNDFECNGVLVCNNGTSNCNCPLALGNKNCDCPNTVGNEYYWNGVNCLPRLTVNSVCKNSSTSYMCKTLSEGTVCVGSGGNFTCQCPSFQYFDTFVQKCLNQLSYNQTCTITLSCRLDLGLSCQTSICLCNSTTQFWNGSNCTNYLTYKDSCTNDNQCNGILICNNGTGNCNCPDPLGDKLCDCPNTLGNEYYWNGGNCLPRLAVNSVCINSNTSYMCKTLSEGTICDGSGTNYTCKCPPLQYFNILSGKCENQLLHNITCTLSLECRTDLGLTCQTSVCLCNFTTQFWNGSMCVNYYTYKDSCTNDFQCNGVLICNNGTGDCNCPDIVGNKLCDCPNSIGNEYYWNGIDCISRISFNGSCSNSSSSYMCKILSEGTICSPLGSNFACQCPIFQYFNTTTSNCQNQSSYNGSCSTNISCRLDLDLSCQSNVCLCDAATQFWNGSVCTDYLTYKDVCSNDFQCKNLLICNTAIGDCNCPDLVGDKQCDCLNSIGNEYYWDGIDCVLRLTHGSYCLDSSSSYMCKTLSEGTICASNGTNYTCQCPNLQYFNTVSLKCENQLNYNQTCSLPISCRSDLGLNCQSSICLCNTTIQFWNGSMCINYLTYKDSCTNDNQCNGVLICNNGTGNCNCPDPLGDKLCDCPNILGNEYYWNGIDCLPRLTVNNVCMNSSTSYMCKTLSEGTVCAASGGNFSCQCPSFQYFDTFVQKCLNQLSYNQTCTITLSCRLDLGLSCQTSICLCNSTTQFWNGSNCTNYLTYKDSCTNDNQCNGILICNNGTGNCNCPDPLGDKFCDCPNTLGNEYYWNGIDCIPRISLNGVCMNSNTSYMCKTLSEGTICDGSGTNYTCKCPPLQYFNILSGKCENQLLHNITCTLSLECRTDLGLTCQTSVCLCNFTTQFWNGSMCVNYYTYKDSCTNDFECNGVLICNNGIGNCNCPDPLGDKLCDCPNILGNEYYWNGIDCLPRISVNGVCINSNTSFMCKTLSEGTICAGSGGNFTCQCSSLQYFNSSYQKCVNRFNINQTCSYTTQCREDLGLFCINSSCICNSTTQFWNGSYCIDYLLVNASCSSSCQCQGLLYCYNGVCVCPRVPGFEYYWSGTDCAPSLPYGGACYNSFTNEMCQMLTQGLICNGSGFNYTCQCPSPKTFNSTGGKCI